ncbi:asparagine synthase (glutamine-hydrolyzing) [Geothrix sp. PMB-07]|uniref:asparagine synthase (glutamine-hydrolyzing) n=1 Tax=Geothrix sp. PMB-07 TaxID=3068640 RepID=UPI0027424A00|nr:asparagine synthase (glutamine-hydrolyzing) [Geothrix sp. PMB-07]WLT30173.1 asparagine synthase (glutamine-hydrolyzing) [Geothrix sp. PMB-07]
MCGFAGCWHGAPLEADALHGQVQGMTDRLLLRGPDDGGIWTDPPVGLGLGFRRLSILDLTEEGHQPKASASGRFIITFNGEIYNFKELRQTLEGLGATFRGHSDTEVILAAIEQWGVEAAVRQLNGMFAIALWDTQERTLHLARDPLGIKPLYVGVLNGTLLWGSELKALRAHPAFTSRIDPDALSLYFRHGFVPSPYSIYAGVRKLAPGHLLTLTSPGGEMQPRPFWTLREVAEEGLANPFGGTDQEAIQAVEASLFQSVGRQMVADVPLGAFLSGGVDSSLIVALMQAQSSRPVQTFCIGFREDSFNEAHHAQAVAKHLGTDHSEWMVSAKDFLGLIPDLPDLYDEPFADPAMIPTCLVSQLARRKVTVSLSGDGGDEVFGGYSHHLSACGGRLSRALSHSAGVRWAMGVGTSTLSSAAGLLPGKSAAFMSDALKYRSHLYRFKDAVTYYRERVAGQSRAAESLLNSSRIPPYLLTEPLALREPHDVVDAFMYLDSMMVLPDEYLTKVDRATMSVSLEGRVPFLDSDVVALAWRLPARMKIRDGRGKWVLRQVLERHVPKEIIDRPKHGFSVPIADWLRGPLKAWGKALLDARHPELQELLSSEAITRVWTEHQQSLRSHGVLLWKLLMFKAWYARWCAED